MTPAPAEEAARWLAQARAELRAAGDLLGLGHHYLVCFLSQQVAEKALKAFLYGKGETLVMGHAVGGLCEWAGRHDAGFAAFKEQVQVLDSYYIPTRYPNGLPPGAIPAETYDRETAQRALVLAERTVQEVTRKLGL